MQNLFRRLEFQYLYFRRPPWDTGISPPELIEFIETHEPGRAIDIGCGTGTNVITLAKAGWRVTGVDFAPRAIKMAKQKLRQAGVPAELLVGDATELRGINGPFELALDLGCFHGIPSEGQAKYLARLDRILAPGGFWLLYAFLKRDSEEKRSALAEAYIERITSQLALISRRDGMDNARLKPSAWFLFQKQS